MELQFGHLQEVFGTVTNQLWPPRIPGRLLLQQPLLRSCARPHEFPSRFILSVKNLSRGGVKRFKEVGTRRPRRAGAGREGRALATHHAVGLGGTRYDG